MVLQVKRIAEASIRLGISADSDVNLVEIWRKRIVGDVLLLAYLNRPATFVTIDPDKNSVGNEFAGNKLLSGKKSYLVNCISNCRQADILTVSESYDLELMYLVITSISCVSIQEFLLESLFPKTDAEAMVVKEELLYCSRDGYVLNWLNFNRSYEDIMKVINCIAKFYQLELNEVML